MTGGLLTYLITVHNAGAADATGVLVYENLPLGTTVTGVSPSRGSCTAPADDRWGALGCRLGSLAAGSSATVRIVFRVTAPAGAHLNNKARFDAVIPGTLALSEAREPPGSNRSDNLASVTTTVKAKPKPKPKPKR